MTKTAAVLGAGTMGHGIAQVLAQAGYSVILRDLDMERVDAGLAKVKANLEGALERGKLEEGQPEEIFGRIRGETDLREAVARVDLVVEAVPEFLDLKREVLGEVSRLAPDLKVLGTNTSSLPVTELAQTTAYPERVIGLHFFNPVHISKLVEVVRGERTAPEVVAESVEMVEAIGKTPIVVGDAPGFASSRLGLVLGLEAMRMVEQGVASAEAIDQAMELGYRHPMGPLKTTDYVGLDVRLAIAEHLHREIGETFRPPQVLRRLVRAGKLGRKSGEGFYRWDDAGKCLGPAV